MADNQPMYLDPKDSRGAAHNPLTMSDQQSITRMLHDPMRPDQMWESNLYRNPVSVSAQQQQQQIRPSLWESEKNLSNAVGRPGLDPIDMTVVAGRHQLYPGLPNHASEQISASGSINPSSVHQLHRGSPSVPVIQGLNTPLPPGNGAKPKNHMYKDGRSDTSRFMEAIKKRNLAEIKRLIEKGVDVNFSENGSTALHIAAKCGDTKVFELLLRYGADPSKKDNMAQLPEDYLKMNNLSVDKLNQNLAKSKQTMNYPGWMQNGMMPGAPASSLVPDMHLLYQPYAPFHLLAPPQLGQMYDLSHPPAQFSNQPLGRIRSDVLGGYEKPHTNTGYVPPHAQPSYDHFPSPFDHMPRPSNSTSTSYNVSQSKYVTQMRDGKSPLTGKQYQDRTNLNYQHLQNSKPASCNDSSLSRNYRRNDTSIYDNYMSGKLPKPQDHRIDNDVKRHHTDKTSFHIEHLARPNSSSPIIKPFRNSSELAKQAYISSASSPYQDTNMLSKSIDVTRIKAPIPTDFYKQADLPRKYPPNIAHSMSASSITTPSTSSVSYYTPHHNGESSFSAVRQNMRYNPSESDVAKCPQDQNFSKMHPAYPTNQQHNSVVSSSVGSVMANSAPLNGWNSKETDKYSQSSVDQPSKYRSHSVAYPSHNQVLKTPSQVTHTQDDRLVARPLSESWNKFDSSIAKNHEILLETTNAVKLPAGDDQGSYVNGGILNKDTSANNDGVTERGSVIHKTSNPDDTPTLEMTSSKPCVAKDTLDTTEKWESANKLSEQPNEKKSSDECAATEPKSKKGRKRKAPIDDGECTEKKQRSQSTDVDSVSTDTTRKLSKDNMPQSEKRQKISETDDEYLWATYDDFSSTDPENDDSSDEDFCCPVIKPIKGKKSGLVKRRPKRHISRGTSRSFNGSSDHSMDVFSDTDQKQHKKKVKQKQAKGLKPKQKFLRKSKSKKSRTISSESCSSFKEQLSHSEENEDKKTKTRSRRPRKHLERGRLKMKGGSSSSRLNDKLKKSRSDKLTRKSKHEKLKRKQKRSLNQKLKNARHEKHDKQLDAKQNKKQSSLDAVDKKQLLIKHDKPVAGHPDKKQTPVISATLLELYTGTTPVLPPKDCSKDADVPKQTSNLFGDELTEKEAQVLKSALGASKPQIVTAYTPSANLVPNESPKDSKESLGGSQLLDTPMKPKKKRGRKPKILTEGEKPTDKTTDKISKKHKLTSPLKEKVGKVKSSKKKHSENFTHKADKPAETCIQKSPNEMQTHATVQAIKQEVPSRPCSPLPETSNKPSLLNQTPINIKDEQNLDQSACLDNLEDTPTTSKFASSFNDFRSFQHGKMSRPSTPLSFFKERLTPHPSPIPQNLKKLTCNSAIGETVLHKAARFGYVENLQHYLERGFDVNSKDNAGYTALHEACVHNQLETARLLLEYGADVNLNSTDGTRPVHDAIEYDHLEMTRLLLSCGADPLLSKFSGRSIRNMIRSPAMDKFLSGYLKELKPLDKNLAEDPDLQWKIAPSNLLDKKVPHVYDVTADPPSSDECDFMDFKIFDKPPLETYYVQPTATASRSNYHLLNDMLEHTKCTRGEFLLQYPVDIKTMATSAFLADVSTNWVPNKKSSLPSSFSTWPLVELVPANRHFGESKYCRVHANGSTEMLEKPSTTSPVKKHKSNHSNSYSEEPCCSYTEKTQNSSVQNPPTCVAPDDVVSTGKGKCLNTVLDCVSDKQHRPISPPEKHFDQKDCEMNCDRPKLFPLMESAFTNLHDNVEPQTKSSFLHQNSDDEHCTKHDPCLTHTSKTVKKLTYKTHDERKLENGFCNLGATNSHLNTASS
uniref:Uncharacterized protein LOC100178568 n=1 Tax=Phallusia mammillata TaxID=59560 RepID=A0A6F9DGA8_9ASCI|nr:uncharacterized protein LOC100178568 [Phallusia mammillata]